MTTRQMWAPKGWTKDHAGEPASAIFGFSDFQYAEDLVPVLVMDDEGMPDFGPGDHVCYKDGPGASSPDFTTNEVEGVYIDSEGRWCVVFTDGDYAFASDWTKLPREKTVTLRLAGPEKDMGRVTEMLKLGSFTKIRVERVEVDE